MSKQDKNRRRSRDLEIQHILDERQTLADDEQMRLNAERYRAKPAPIDIFSNKDRRPRLTNTNPLEADKPKEDNAIVGEKTAATMQASLMMDGSEELPRIPGEPPKPSPIVTLSPEYDAETRFSGEVLNEVEQFSDGSPIENIDSIDISMEPQPRTEEEPPAAEEQEEASASEQAEDAERIVAKVPVYRPTEPSAALNVKAGRFSEVVAHEYEEYLHSKNPAVLSHVIRPDFRRREPVVVEDEDIFSTKERFLGAVVGYMSKDEAEAAKSSKKKKQKEKEEQEAQKPVEDYTGEEDEKSIRFELNGNIRKLFFRSLISGVITVIAVILTVITRFFPAGILSAIPVAPAAYAAFNLIMLVSVIVLNRSVMINGLSPLIRFKGSSDTAVAVAGCAAILQTAGTFPSLLSDMSKFTVSYYCVIVLLAFFVNSVGKLMMVRRVKDNFRFLSAKGQKYAAKIYNNESVANKMLSGTLSEKNLIAYQHKTGFASNFLKISYAPDPGEELAAKLAPVTTVIALAMALLCGVLRLSYTEAFSTFALLAAIAVPITTMTAVNRPVKKLCHTLTEYGAMLTGYPSIKQFCDSTAIMIDAVELFPTEAIDLEGIKTFEDYNVDESLLCGIAVLKEARNPIANAFASVVSETKETLPEVESVLYEDDLGLVGWINGERILVGARALMDKYQVYIPSDDYEEKYAEDDKQITYLSRAGRLIAILVTRYRADPELKSEMQRAEANGISFLIRTTDFNITEDLVAKLYNVFYRSIKVLPTGLGNALNEAQTVTEEQSRAYLVTHGKASALARAVSGCVRIKQNISLAIVIQLIAVILGLLIAVPLVLYAGVGVMGTIEVLIYILFWALASMIAPAIQKP